MLRPGAILSHSEMCGYEGKGLQHGMHFRTTKTHSVLLMSQRSGAPYPDRLSEDGSTLYYLGHDAYGVFGKEQIDQPLAFPNGTLTQNGKFFKAHAGVLQGARELVRVYEKLRTGVWVFNGLFELLDARMEFDGRRNVCVFELHLVRGPVDIEEEDMEVVTSPGRMIPAETKLAVFKRDKGRCAECGATKDLHFDHIIPWSRGGSSINPNNIQLLCQRHNLAKSAKIE